MISSALSSKRSAIILALREKHFAHSVYLDIEVEGIPGVKLASLFAWPEPPGRPVRIGVDVVRLDATVLDPPISYGFTLKKRERGVETTDADDGTVTVRTEDVAEFDDTEDRPAVIRTGRVEWRLCANTGVQREVCDLGRDGQAIFQNVDTAVFCYKLICAKCGRARYAKRNSLHQVIYCRICTKQGRLRKRRIANYKDRVREGKRRRIPPHIQEATVARIADGQVTSARAAVELKVSPSTISRMLRRRGAR